MNEEFEKAQGNKSACWPTMRHSAASWVVDARAKERAIRTGQAVETVGVNGDVNRFEPDGSERQVRPSNRRD